jgi:hypothetical protein
VPASPDIGSAPGRVTQRKPATILVATAENNKTTLQGDAHFAPTHMADRSAVSSGAGSRSDQSATTAVTFASDDDSWRLPAECEPTPGLPQSRLRPVPHAALPYTTFLSTTDDSSPINES